MISYTQRIKYAKARKRNKSVSTKTKTEEYLLMVIKYIHNSPVQAKMLNELLEDRI